MFRNLILSCVLLTTLGLNAAENWKSWNGVAKANIKTFIGVAEANIKSWNGVDNTAGGGDFTTGLVTWFYAPDLTNANNTIITTWTNRGSGSSIATYVAGDAYKQANQINGLTVLASTNLANAAIGFTPSDVGTAFTVMWVGRIIAAASDSGVFDHRVASGNGFGMPGDGTAYRPHLTVYTAAGEVSNRRGTLLSVPTAAVLLTWTWNGTTSVLYTNGVADTSNEAGGAGYGASGQIARSYSTATLLTGEIRVWPSVLSDANRGTATTALKTAWGIP